MGMGLKLPPFINPICGWIGRPCPDASKKVWHLYVGIWDGNPIYGSGVKIAPDITSTYAGLERSCPRDSKTVSYVDVGLKETCLDLIESYGWDGGGGLVGGLSKNLVKHWA